MLAAAGNDSQAHEALSSLCQTYWYSLYAYLRRRGLDPERIRDLTQGFLTSLIERQDFEGLRQDRGRFRAFLLASLKHYLSIGRHVNGRRSAAVAGRWSRSRTLRACKVVEPVNHATPETLFQHESSGTDMEANCSGADGAFWSVLRLHWPKEEATSGKWIRRRTIFRRNFDRRRERRCCIISWSFAPERCQNADVDSPFRCSRQHVDKLPAAERRSGIQQSRRHAGSRAVTTWRASEHHAGGFGPGGYERGLQLPHGGALEAHIRLAPRSIGPTVPKPFVVDAEATGPSDTSIDDDAEPPRSAGRMPAVEAALPEADQTQKCSSSSGSIPTWHCWQNHGLRCRYLGDTRRFGPCTRTTPGVVPKTITSSPSGATNKPNDAPSPRTV